MDMKLVKQWGGLSPQTAAIVLSSFKTYVMMWP